MSFKDNYATNFLDRFEISIFYTRDMNSWHSNFCYDFNSEKNDTITQGN